MTSPSSTLMPRHFSEHLGAEKLLVFRFSAPRENQVEELRGSVEREIRGAGGGMAVVGCGATKLLESRARFFESVQISRESTGVFAGHLSKTGNVFPEAGEFRIDNGIGAEGGDNARPPCGVADGQMVSQRIERRVSGGEDVETKALVEGARQELGREKLLGDGVVVEVGVLRTRGARSDRRAPERHSRATCAWGFREKGSSGRRRCARPCAGPLARARRFRDLQARRPGCRACGKHSGQAERRAWRDRGRAGCGRTTRRSCARAG